MSQYDVPLLQANASNLFERVTLAPTSDRNEITTAPTTKVPTAWVRGAAGIYTASNGSTTAISAVNTWTSFLFHSTVSAERGAADGDVASSHIAVSQSGMYLVTYSVTFTPAAANKVWSFGVLESGSLIGGSLCRMEHPTTVAATVALSVVVSITATKNLTIGVQNNTDDTDVTITQASLSVVQIA